jgi:hypothetical protein
MQLLTQSKNNVLALELMRQLGVSYRTGWLVKHKILEAIRVREDWRELSGRVEIDDAYLGDELSGGTAGRGSENGVLFGVCCAATREIAQSFGDRVRYIAQTVQHHTAVPSVPAHNSTLPGTSF